MIKLARLFSIAILALFILGPATSAFAQDEDEEAVEDDDYEVTNGDVLEEVYEEHNDEEGDSAAEQILDELME